MKFNLFFIISLFVVLGSSFPGNAESIKGEVVSVDHDNQQIIVQIESENGQPSKITLKTDGPLPNWAKPGIVIRAKGDFDTETQTFAAISLRNHEISTNKDLSRVRSRLRKHKTQRKRKHHRQRRRRR